MIAGPLDIGTKILTHFRLIYAKVQRPQVVLNSVQKGIASRSPQTTPLGRCDVAGYLLKVVMFFLRILEGPVTRCFFVNSVVMPNSRTILEISGLLHAFTAHQFMILIVCSSLLATQMLLCPFDHAGKFLPHPNPKIQKGLAG